MYVYEQVETSYVDLKQMLRILILNTTLSEDFNCTHLQYLLLRTRFVSFSFSLFLFLLMYTLQKRRKRIISMFPYVISNVLLYIFHLLYFITYLLYIYILYIDCYKLLNHTIEGIIRIYYIFYILYLHDIIC